jgi:hypothetical protein
MSEDFRTEKSLLSELIQKNDSLGIQMTLSSILNRKLKNAIREIDLQESANFIDLSDEEYDIVSNIQSNARSFGAKEVNYSFGVAMVDFSSKKAVEDFTGWLDTDENVENYEIEVLVNDDGAEVVSDISFDEIVDDQKFEFIVTVYLDSGIVDYSMMDDESISEGVVRKIRVNSMGLKTVKMQCQKGSKWDAERRTCVVIVGQELSIKRQAIKRSILTKRAGGMTLKRRTIRKMKKADKFRKMMGLPV